MATSGKDTGIVGYNVQTAVDTKNHIIVAHEVTNVGTDRRQLSNMADRPRYCYYFRRFLQAVGAALDHSAGPKCSTIPRPREARFGDPQRAARDFKTLQDGPSPSRLHQPHLGLVKHG